MLKTQNQNFGARLKEANTGFWAKTHQLFLYCVISLVLRSPLKLSDQRRQRLQRSQQKRKPGANILPPEASLEDNSLYQKWIAIKEVTDPAVFGKDVMSKDVSQPTLVVCLVGRADDLDLAAETLRSLQAQTYLSWSCQTQFDLAGRDARVKQSAAPFGPDNFRPSDGAYVLWLQAGTILAPHALAMFIRTARSITADLYYADHDHLDFHGTRLKPVFKPDWNRSFFYETGYIGPAFLTHASLWQDIGETRAEDALTHGYSFVLRALQNNPDLQMHHIPHVLFHRSHNSSEASLTACKNALQTHLHATGQQAAETILQDGRLRVQWCMPEDAPKVTLIIPTRDHKKLLETAVTSILEETRYPNFEILIVDNASTCPETLSWMEEISQSSSQVRVIRYGGAFNYSAINNFAAAQTDAEFLALVNNDVEIIDSDWLSEMVAWGLQADVGCVGAKLLYPDGRIQHGGIILGLGGVAGHSHKLFPGTHAGYMGRLQHCQDISAVTAACLLVRRSIYEHVGGLDETNLKVAFNDVDFCLRVRAAGFRNIWTPDAVLVHHESISRGTDQTRSKRDRFKAEVRFMQNKWGADLYADPHYNPNLTRINENFQVRVL